MKLHLGCGPKFIEVWKHYDALEFPHVDIVGPVDQLPLEDCSAEIIYASHFLEHFSLYKCVNVLKEWYRVLKLKGILRLAVPNFTAACEIYSKLSSVDKIETIKVLVCGGQKNEYDYHGNIFDYLSLESALKSAGFKTVRTWNLRETEHSHIDDYSQAYLSPMDKNSGKLMSLNVEGLK